MNVISLPVGAVEVKDGHPVTTSLRVAEIFGKRHDRVLRAIRDLVAQVSEEFRRANFGETVYMRENPSGGSPIETPMFDLSRDGFTLLAMGFTGPKALAFKLAYIERFNALEAAQFNGRNFALVVPPELTLGEFHATRAHLRDLQAELDVLFGQFKAAKITVTHDEIEEMDKPYERISNRRVRTRDLLALTDAHGMPRKAIEDLLGITNGNARQHVYHGRHERKEAA